VEEPRHPHQAQEVEEPHQVVAEEVDEPHQVVAEEVEEPHYMYDDRGQFGLYRPLIVGNRRV
jgi:hypothetical protein